MRFLAAAGASLWLAPGLASAQDVPPADGPAPADGRAPRNPAAGPPPSDEDLEAAVLGGGANPPAPAPAPSAPPPAARRPPVATPPPPARRPPAATSQEHPWPPPAAPASPDDPEARPSLAIELGTSGLASGALQGGLFLGARWPSGLIAGGALDYGSSSLSIMSAPGSTSESGASVLRLSAGIRYPAMRTEDGRVELFLAAELGVIRSSREIPVEVNSAQNYTAFGPTAAAGPGLRLWVHERVAIGYVARFRVTHLSGKSSALLGTTTTTPLGFVDQSDASSTDMALEGAFQLLGVF